MSLYCGRYVVLCVAFTSFGPLANQIYMYIYIIQNTTTITIHYRWRILLHPILDVLLRAILYTYTIYVYIAYWCNSMLQKRRFSVVRRYASSVLMARRHVATLLSIYVYTIYNVVLSLLPPHNQELLTN